MAITKKLAIPTIILFTATGIALAQNLTEKIDVSIVNVDVTVTSHGAPARGLTRDDFEVLEDGVPQSITNFYAIEKRPGKKTVDVPSTTTTAAGAPDEVDQRFRRKVLIIMDNRHMSVHNRDVALSKLEQFINEGFDSGSYEWSIAMIGDRTLLLPITSDKERIHRALAEIRYVAAGRNLMEMYQIDDHTAPIIPNNSETDFESILRGTGLGGLVERSELGLEAADAATTYEGILQVARSFAQAPGRKIILLMTGGFPDPESALFREDPQLAATLASLRNSLVREANASDVSISAIDTEGIIPVGFGADTRGRDSLTRAGVELGDMKSSSQQLYWITRQTGGENFTGNFVDRSIHDFDVDSSNFYSLAYRPNHAEDSKYHSITVRMKKPGRYTLAYRNGYSSLSVEAQIDRAMGSVMAAEIQPSSIALSLAIGGVTADAIPGVILVRFTAAVPAKELQFVPTPKGSTAQVDLFVSLFNENGGLIRRFRTVQAAHAEKGKDGSLVASNVLRLRKGTPYHLVVAVHDQVSDAIGIKSEVIRF